MFYVHHSHPEHLNTFCCFSSSVSNHFVVFLHEIHDTARLCTVSSICLCHKQQISRWLSHSFRFYTWAVLTWNLRKWLLARQFDCCHCKNYYMIYVFFALSLLLQTENVYSGTDMLRQWLTCQFRSKIVNERKKNIASTER